MLKAALYLFFSLLFVLNQTILPQPTPLRAKRFTPELEQQVLKRLKRVENSKVLNQTVDLELGRSTMDFSVAAIPSRLIALANTRGAVDNGLHFLIQLREPNPRYLTYVYDKPQDGLLPLSGSIIWERHGGRTGSIVNGPGGAVWGVGGSVEAYYFFDQGKANFDFTVAEFDSIRSGRQSIDLKFDEHSFLVVVASGSSHNILAWSTDGINFESKRFSTNYLDPTSDESSEYEKSIVINPTNWDEWRYVATERSSYKPQTGKVVIWTTTDQGATWSGELIWENATVNPDGSQYWIERFSQVFGDYSDDGVFHVVANGYGLDRNGINLHYPVVYWNSNIGTFIDITPNDIAAHPADTDTTLDGRISQSFPGNHLGNAYPQLSFGIGTNAIIAAWSRPEIVDGEVILAQNGYYGTDIWFNYSADGTTWREPRYLAGVAEQSDIYPCLPKYFTDYGNGHGLVDVMYMQDFEDGISVFGESDAVEVAWVYNRFEFDFESVDITHFPENTGDFQLEQNYPNPFNPSTTIRYSLPRPAKVTVSIHDVLGKKVDQLTSERQPAGAYLLVWDGSDQSGRELDSGVYFIRLQADSYGSTKKMVLIR